MGNSNHTVPPWFGFAKGELATRLTTYAGVLGLSNQQIVNVNAIVKSWREQYVSDGGALVATAQEIYTLYDAKPVDLPALSLKITKYTDDYNQLLRGFVAAVADLSAELTNPQFTALKTLHDDEGAVLPFRQVP